MTPRQVLYLSHGSPDLTLVDHPAHPLLRELGDDLSTPPGALVISAHFEDPGLVVGAAERPETWHDFHGFPATL